MATAWIAGGSGLVGGVLLGLLLEDERFDHVVSIGRRKLPLDHPKLIQVPTEFTPPLHLGDVPPPTIAFSCLGTTIKKAGYIKQAFRMVDHDSVVAFAEAARQQGASVFIHVTALGADPHSRTFYNAVKGETELSVARLGFPSVYALRPSILDGHRSERRPAERLGLAVARALGPLLGKYRPTPVAAIAHKMIMLARSPAPGTHTVENTSIV
jgi:uncharacterized protein YbjT (DUF2867 family)